MDIEFHNLDSNVRKKIFLEPRVLAKIVENLKKQGKLIVFGNGTFDLLHSGHVNYLYAAKSLGDILIIGINSDESVEKLGKEKTCKNESERMALIAAMGCVDYVVPFSEKTPADLILSLKPDIHTKGTDYTIDMLPEKNAIESHGGVIALVGGPKIGHSREIREKIRNSLPSKSIKENLEGVYLGDMQYKQKQESRGQESEQP